MRKRDYYFLVKGYRILSGHFCISVLFLHKYTVKRKQQFKKELKQTNKNIAQ